ncbi:MAG: type IV pilus secretin PilQ [Candidatus Zixiibacteriota bacterium]
MMKKKNYWRLLLLGLAIFLLLFPSFLTAAGKQIKSLTLKEADIHAVLSFLADYGKVNIVTSPAVEGNVNLALQRINWEEALDIVLKTYDLAGVEEKGYIRVLPMNEYMQEVMAKEKHKSDQEALISLKTEVIKIENATASELVKPVKTVLSARGLIDVDERTNSLIVRDIPANITRAKEMVQTLDMETDQIEITAQLLEVESSALEELGIDWTFFTGRYGPANANGGYKTSHEALIEQMADRVSDPIGSFTYTTVQEDFDLSGRVSALMKDKKAKILASPVITTMDNKQALIQMGQKIPVKQFDASGNVVITFVEVGTILRVTPHITSEDRVLMNLRPERSSYQFDPNGVIINTNNAETNVVVGNGQPAVIGGLTSQEKKTTKTGIPILKDIPVIGYLFSYTQDEIINRELIITVTPRVVTREIHGGLDSTLGLEDN